MDVRTCKSCKRIFNYLSGPIMCPACIEKLEEKFKEVKDYILHASEIARRKRRTMNTLNIDADDIDMDVD